MYIIVHYSLQVQEVWLCLPRPLPHPHALQLWPEKTTNQLPSIRTQEGTRYSGGLGDSINDVMWLLWDKWLLLHLSVLIRKVSNEQSFNYWQWLQ